MPGLALAAVVATALLFPGCIGGPPERLDDLCEIFDEKHGWYRAAHRSYERWGVPEWLQAAVIHQESRFRARARPPRRRILWIFPGPRPSSAYGYGQVVNSTWDQYRRARGRPGADRDDFRDVADFLGWYGSRIQQRAGVPKNDPYAFYLAYHEGPGGYARGSHRRKAWLLGVARKVEHRARRYRAQYAGCREELASRRWWWPF